MVTCGSYNLVDLLRELSYPLALHVRRYLRELVAVDYPDLGQLVKPDGLSEGNPSQRLTGNGPEIVLNARLLPSIECLKSVRALLEDKSCSGIVWDGDHVAAVVRPGWSWEWVSANIEPSVEQMLLAAHEMPRLESGLKLAAFPHEVIAANMEIIHDSLEYRISSGEFQQTADGVFVADGAKLGEYVLTETDDGPIVIDSGASIGPYTLLRGPIYIGRNSRILEHAAIKDAVSLGHTTKIGGEVEASIVEPFSNKQHHGFLGHSYLGSWINLGAGTCNSDLKNTYGTVNMEYPNGKAATGMQFLGCVMGDYTKTAINTGIFTGKVIGVCSMMYGFVTSNVPSYVNYARLFGQMTTLPPEVMIATQKRMFSRRKVEQRECDMQLLHDMYRMTQAERDRFSEVQGF